VGHSLGSALLNFGAIIEGEKSPFDSLLLTGYLNTTLVAPSDSVSPAREVDPAQWGTLDPAYITAVNRTFFYPLNNSSYSPRMLALDELTKDLGSISTSRQVPAGSFPVPGYRGNVVKLVGAQDQFWCTGGRCSDTQALRDSGRVLWPDAKSFDVVVTEGSGHDLNLDFFATRAFENFFSIVERFSR